MIGLYLLIGLCWLPVVWIQIRIRNLVATGHSRDSYRHLMRAWTALGLPAFSAMILIFYLMVTWIGTA